MTTPIENQQAVSNTIRVSGYVDDLSSKVKIENIEVITFVGDNGLYFDTDINVPSDGKINIEAADAAGNLATPVEIQVILANSGASAVSVSYYNYCVIINGGADCGDGPIPGLESGVTDLSAGFNHACAVVNGAAKCWGANLEGQLGNGTTNYSSVPVSVTGLESGVTAIGAGSNHSCAIVNGNAKCWGWNRLGQLGNGTGRDSSVPVPLLQIGNGVTKLAVGLNHSCIVYNGAVMCWGYNGSGEAAPRAYGVIIYDPKIIEGVPAGNIEDLDAGFNHTCVLIEGEVFCWGSNGNGQFGDGTNSYSFTPVRTVGLTSGIKKVTTGFYHTCAIDALGYAKCWGSNGNGQLGNGLLTDSNLPVNVTAILTPVSDIGAGASATCAIVDKKLRWSGPLELIQVLR